MVSGLDDFNVRTGWIMDEETLGFLIGVIIVAPVVFYFVYKKLKKSQNLIINKHDSDVAFNADYFLPANLWEENNKLKPDLDVPMNINNKSNK